MSRMRAATVVLIGVLALLPLLATADLPWSDAAPLSPGGDAATAVFGGLGVIFGVMLAQLVVAGWDDYQSARIASFREAAALRNLVRLADGFTPAQRVRILTMTGDYARALIDEEWPNLQGGGELGEAAEDAIHHLFQFYAGVDMSSERGSPYLDLSIHKLGELSDARAERLASHRSQLPEFVWLVLAIEAALVIGFIGFFEAGDGAAHAALFAALTVAIVLLLGLIWALDHPFQHIARIGPDEFQDVLRLVRNELETRADAHATSESAPRPGIYDIA
jgi:hypothetical protein